MARSIAVKVPVAQLIADIEAAIAKIDEDVKNYPQARAQYELDVKEYSQLVRERTIAYITTNPDSWALEFPNSWNNKVSITVPRSLLDLPDAPVAPNEPNRNESFGREYTTRKALLERNLRILKMTTQEEVNASTYGAIIELL